MANLRYDPGTLEFIVLATSSFLLISLVITTILAHIFIKCVTYTFQRVLSKMF